MRTNPRPTSTPPVEETIAIEGMRCGHCVAAVREALEAAPGVTVTDVTVGEARLCRDPGLSDRAAVEAVIEAAGFTSKR